MLTALVVLGIAGISCFPKQGSYPIEIFTEMHYSQAYRSQEPPRLDAVQGAEVFVPIGSDVSLEVPEKRQRPYNSAVAAELFRVNCSTCHGVRGEGDGPIVPFLTSTNTVTGKSYGRPPDLLESRDRLNEDAVFAIVTNGIVVMPVFSLLLPEEERWDIVAYIFDREGGLEKAGGR